MGKKTKTPDPTDLTVALPMQDKLNQQAFNQNLNTNRVNQSNPYGNLTWQQDANGNWTQSVAFNPQQQEIFNQQQQNQGLLGGLAGSALGGYDTSQVDFSKLGAMPEIGQYNQQATDLYNKLAQPQLDRQRAAKEAQLAAMGLNLGSGQAYNTQQDLLNDAANRSAMMAAQAGIQQGNTMFGQGMQLRQQGANEMLAQKSANLGQLSGLMGLQQNLGTPQFSNYNQVQAPTLDLMGALNNNYNQQMNATNAQNADNANKNQAMGTAASIAATAAIAF